MANFTPMSPPRSTTWGSSIACGHYAQAEPLLTRALAINEKLLGLDHPDVALSVVSLAQLRVVQGSRKKRNHGTVEPWRLESGRWGRPISAGLFMNTCYVVRSFRSAGLFSFGLLDGLQVRLRRPYVREAPRALVSNASRRHS